VQLDSDWNKQVAILLHALRTFSADVIGQHGGPAVGAGFGLSPSAERPDDLIVGPGR